MSGSFAFPPPPPPPPKAAISGNSKPSSFPHHHNKSGPRDTRGSSGGQGKQRNNRVNGEVKPPKKHGEKLKPSWAASSNAQDATSIANASVNAQPSQPQTSQAYAYPYGYTASHQSQAQQPQDPATQWYQAAAAAHYAQYAQFAATGAAYQKQAYAAYAAFSQANYALQSGYAGTPYYPQGWNTAMTMPAQNNAQAVAPAPSSVGFGGQHSFHNSSHLPDSSATKKRKREAFFKSQQSTSHGRNNPVGKAGLHRPKVQTAPAVPSFGFTFPTPPATAPTSAGASDKPESKKKKREVNRLGLTPRKEEREDSEEDVDEEAAFVGFNLRTLQYEYGGKTHVLLTAKDIAAWIEERKRNYPTQARIAQKRAEAIRRNEEAEARKKARIQQNKEADLLFGRDIEPERRAFIANHLERAGAMRLKLEKSKAKASRKAADRAASQASALTSPPLPKRLHEPNSNSSNGNGHGLPAQTLDEMISEYADSKPAEKQSMLDLKLDYSSEGSGTESDTESTVSVSSSSTDTSSASSASASSASGKDDRKRQRRIKQSKSTPRPVCNALVYSNKCTAGRRCKFSHDWEMVKNARKERAKQKKEQQEQPKRLSLYQRLVEQEQREADILVLNAIKYLGHQGVLEGPLPEE